MLALAILVGGLLYLGRYQDRLIESELALGRKPASSPEPSARPPSPVAATKATTCPTIWRARWCASGRDDRYQDPAVRRFGTLVADSRVLIGPGGVVQIEELPPPVQGGWLTRLAIDLYDEIVNALPSRDKFPVFREGPVQAADHYETWSGR